MTVRSFRDYCSHGARCMHWRMRFAGAVWVYWVLAVFSPAQATALQSDAPAPPARVGQLSLVTGSARMRVGRASPWEPAAVNTPLTTGSALATEKASRAEVRVGSAALRLAQGAKVLLTEVNDSSLHIEINHGLVALRVRALAPGERVLLSAGGATVQLLSAGAYRVRHVARESRLMLWVLEGQARVALNQQDTTLGANQHLQLDTRTSTRLESTASNERTSFDEFADVRDRLSERSVSLLYVSAEMTGAEALDGHGTWHDEAGYGAVWFPDRLPMDWAPYRFGRWRWLAPWGWTWIDDAPWGFAPTHYGRWLFTGGRWGWVASPSAAASTPSRPLFAPALVGFFGSQESAVWNPAAAATPVVGWYPLAPGEIYWPAYSTQLPYVRALNAANVSDMGQIRALPAANVAGPPHRYARTAFAASAMPYAAFVGMQDVASNQFVLTPAVLAQAPLSGRRWPPPQPAKSVAPAAPASAMVTMDDEAAASPAAAAPLAVPAGPAASPAPGPKAPR
jgi:hypothetical protein